MKSFWDGFDNVSRQMKLYDAKIRASIEKSVETGMLNIADRAKGILTENRHVKTGNLRRSIKGDAKFVSRNVVEGTVGTDVHYAPYVEALPDGGYLFRSVTERLPAVSMNIQKELAEILS